MGTIMIVAIEDKNIVQYLSDLIRIIAIGDDSTGKPVFNAHCISQMSTDRKCHKYPLSIYDPICYNSFENEVRKELPCPFNIYLSRR